MSKDSKKLISAVVSVFCTFCFIIVSVCIYKTGVIKGINTDADEGRKRIQIKLEQSEIVEGLFIDRNGAEITSYADSGEMAISNYPESLSYLIGYNSKRLGTSGLRKKYYTEIFDGKKDKVGASVFLTVDASVQDRLYGLLKGSVGSISVINAATGEIISLASRGDPEIGFNVNLIDTVYEENESTKTFYSDLYNRIDEFWYDRSVLAQDPPGSCAKIITTVCLLENDKADLTYTDTGYELDGLIHNYGYAVYGDVNLEKALNNSINTYFANAGLVLGGAKLKKTFNRFMVGTPVELDFTTLQSTFLKATNFSEFLVASNSYGQGELIMSPLHLAMTAGAIMNNGKMMHPYVVDHITNDNKTTYKSKSEVLSDTTDEDTAKEVKDLLYSNALFYGLYDHFSEDEVYIIAKTGTAEVGTTDKGDHIYYTLGIEINGVPYGICIDEVFSHGTGSSLKSKAISTIEILLDELQ